MTGTREQHEFIKMRLRLAGSSLACIARELGIQPTTVTATSQGKRRSRRIEQAIARKLGCTPHSLLPGRHAEASAEGAPP